MGIQRLVLQKAIILLESVLEPYCQSLFCNM